MGPCHTECCANRDKEKHWLWKDKIHTQAAFVPPGEVCSCWSSGCPQRGKATITEATLIYFDPQRLSWGQTAKVLNCLSSSCSRLRSCSVCRWKDMLISVCHELGLCMRACGTGWQWSHHHNLSHTASAWSCWLAWLCLTHKIGQVFIFFLVTTEHVSTSLTLLISAAGYCWTLPQAQTGVCVM